MFISEFIILFMSKLVHLQPNDSTRHCAQEAYSKTLAKHHSWIIRHGALFAMNFLPCQKDLYNQVGMKNYFLEFCVSSFIDTLKQNSYNIIN